MFQAPNYSTKCPSGILIIQAQRKRQITFFSTCSERCYVPPVVDLRMSCLSRCLRLLLRPLNPPCSCPYRSHSLSGCSTPILLNSVKAVTLDKSEEKEFTLYPPRINFKQGVRMISAWLSGDIFMPVAICLIRLASSFPQTPSGLCPSPSLSSSSIRPAAKGSAAHKCLPAHKSFLLCTNHCRAHPVHLISLLNPIDGDND